MTSMMKEFSFLREYFKMNGFPTSLTYSYIAKFIRKVKNPPQETATVEKFNSFIILPYFGSQSDKLKIDLERVIERHIGCVKINVVFVNRNLLGSFFGFKDALPMELKSSVVYSYCCPKVVGCGSYVGSTIRPLYKRISEHAGRSFRTNQMLSRPSHSEIRNHSNNCGCEIDKANFSILGSAKDDVSLRMLETLFIRKLKPNLNDMNSAFPLKIAF